MAVPVRLRNVPEYLQAQFTDYYDGRSHSQGTKSQELLQFPQSTCVLWDGTSTGSPVFLHVAQNRKPRLQLCEKLLWLIHKQVDSEGSQNKVLVGSLTVDQDADGVSFKIDRLDTRQTDVNSSLLQDDVLIPVQISTNSSQQGNGGSKEDYAEAIKMLQKRCCSQDGLELNSLLLVKGWCSVRHHQKADQMVAHLQFDLVTPANVFRATPLNPVPLIPSALAKNLAGPRSLSVMQGRPKMGYLSMDATRKLLLVLETDPKVASLPVVGIWVSGVSMVNHPFVWGACLRYLHNQRLQDRVCVPPEGFLLMLYSSLHSKPEFYEIDATSGKADLQFELYTGYEVTTLFKKSSGPEVLEWELSPVRNGPKREMFDGALDSVKCQRQEEEDNPRPSPSMSSSEDMVPRMTPAPHQSNVMTIRPMVPDLSMIWTEDSTAAPSSGLLPPFSSLGPPNPPASLNTAFTSTPAPNFSVPTERRPAHLGPSFQGSNSVASGDRLNRCGGGDCGKAQDSDCVPRTAFPVQYAPPQSAQSNSVRTYGHGFGALGYAVAASSSAASPQSSAAPYVGSQAACEFRGSFPLQAPQGGACGVQQQRYPPQASHPQHPHPPYHPHPHHHLHPPAPHHPLQQMYGPGGFPPQPHPSARPRLTAPTSVHFCPPPVAGGPVPHWSLNTPRPAPGNPLSHLGPCAAGQRFPAFTAASHPPAYPPVPSSAPAHCTSIPQGTAMSHAVMGQANNALSSPQGTTTYLQGMHPPPLGTTTSAQMRPTPRLAEGSGMCSQQHRHPPLNAFPTPQVGPDPQSRAGPYAQIPSGKLPLGTTQPGLGYTQPQEFVSTADAGAGGYGLAPSAQTGNNDSQQSDSTTSSSTKSSNDSGLSVTPDRSHPSPKAPSLFPQTTIGVEEGGAQACGLEGVNWAGVPNQVVTLLVQQDAQLRQLQAQIQQLLTQQQQNVAAPSPNGDVTSTPTHPSSNVSTPSTVRKETCSTAVNTTFLPSGSPWVGPGQATQCASIQTTPQKQPPSGSCSPHIRDTPLSPQRLQSCRMAAVDDGMRGAVHTPGKGEGGSMGNTPCDLRHQGSVQLCSTEHEELSANKTGSLHSTASLEQPSPVRSMESNLQLSHSTPSPLSASMCVRPDESEIESTAQDVSPDSKEYYDQLINNIRLFLNNHSQDTDNAGALDATDALTVTAAEDSNAQAALRMFDSTLEASPSPHPPPALPSGGGAGSGNANSNNSSTLFPHINYLSMMLGSDSDASLEINAMAMKYLRDDQLTQAAHRHHHHPGSANQLLLRQALAASLDATSASDISRMGLSPSNLSMASRKYLEKHGLLGGGGGQGESIMLDTDQTIRLQTDFSLAVMSDAHSSLPSSPHKGVGSHPQSPVKRELLKPLPFAPSPAIVEERAGVAESDRRPRLGDLGASPVLRPPPGLYRRDSSPEDTPVFPDRYRGPQHQHQQFIDTCSMATEDERVLDIEKLKQMPKLL